MTLMEVLASSKRAVHRDHALAIDMTRAPGERYFRRTFDGEEDDFENVRPEEIHGWPWDGWREATKHDLDLFEDHRAQTEAFNKAHLGEVE
jgi:hypothetical protein